MWWTVLLSASLMKFNEFMGNDPTDIKKALSFSKPAKFIQASALEMSKSDQVLSEIIDQIPKDITIDVSI